MSKEKAVEVEVEVKEAPEKEQDVADEIAETLGIVVDETVKLFTTLGKAVLNTAQDVSNLMVIKVDKNTREHLDIMVDAGVARNRRDAASSLIGSGIKAEGELFDRITKTRAQIDELRQQIRGLIPG